MEFDPTIQSEKIGFDAADQMICASCGRANGPKRASCIYCGNDIGDANRTVIRIEEETLDETVLGFNIVACGSVFSDPDAAARLFGRDVADIEQISVAGAALPIARFADAGTAAVMLDRSLPYVSGLRIICDRDLDPTNLPRRISRIDQDDGMITLTNFNTLAVTTYTIDTLSVIVSGVHFRNRSSVLEKRGRRGRSKLLDEDQFASDDKVLDIYFTGDRQGYRVNTTGFDFTCIGESRSLLAAENIDRLADRLSGLNGTVSSMAVYDQIRRLIDPVWQLSSQTDFNGIVRSGLGRSGFGKATETNNFSQFLKFSRLQQVINEI